MLNYCYAVLATIDVEAIGTMLEAESRYLTLVKRYIETVAGTAVAAGSESTGVDNASDAWFEVRIDPEAYRRLEDAVRIISEGRACNVFIYLYLVYILY